MNTYRVTLPANGDDANGGLPRPLPTLPNALGLLYITIPVAFVGLQVAAGGFTPNPTTGALVADIPTLVSSANTVVNNVTPGPGVRTGTAASDEGFGGGIVYSGPANSVFQLALTGAEGTVQISWSPAADPGNSSTGFNVTTATLSINPTYPASYGIAIQKGIAKAAAASSLGHGSASAASTALLIAGGVAATGVGAAVLAGVLTDNGPGWLFGIAAESAMEASESIRRRFRPKRRR